MDIHHRLEQLWVRCFAADKGSAGGESWSADRILAQRLLAGAQPDWTTGVSHVHAGEALRAEGRCSEALTEYGLAFAHTAPSTNLLLYVVIGFAAMQDLPAAEAWGYRLIEHGGDSADVYLHLAIAVWNSGRQDEALALCEVNVARHPKHVGAVATAAGFYMATARSSKALEVCLGLLVLDPDAFLSTPNFYKIVASAAISSDQQLPSSCLAKIEAQRQIQPARSRPATRLQCSSFARRRVSPGPISSPLTVRPRPRSSPLCATFRACVWNSSLMILLRRRSSAWRTQPLWLASIRAVSLGPMHWRQPASKQKTA